MFKYIAVIGNWGAFVIRFTVSLLFSGHFSKDFITDWAVTKKDAFFPFQLISPKIRPHIPVGAIINLVPTACGKAHKKTT
jgi:hypothetical protein